MASRRKGGTPSPQFRLSETTPTNEFVGATRCLEGARPDTYHEQAAWVAMPRRPVSALWRKDAYPLTGTLMALLFSAFGSVTDRTPFSQTASIFSSSTSVGSTISLRKEPEALST